MAAPPLGSILLGTTNPQRLRDWYAAALGPEGGGFTEVSPTMFAGNFGDVGLLIDGRDDVADKNPEPGRVILNFHVQNARATAARLDDLGVTWLVEPEEREGGVFGTLVDPDGNFIQIIELREG
ncbi:MAG TPA: VOC family protein [Acidimicrobiia bacterium]|jgi:catechol 2,3-dioxygenase-like lactoylglutathione lyase family enzyme|nr:VOC family protein [Acidimicrobiia bacterium]